MFYLTSLGSGVKCSGLFGYLLYDRKMKSHILELML